MATTLSDIRYKIRVTKNKIRDKEKYIRQKNRRIEDIDEAIRSFFKTDSYVEDINNFLLNSIDALKAGATVDGHCVASTDLNNLKEGGSYSDSKINAAIHELEQEKSITNHEITSARNEVDSLNNRLYALKEEEERLLNEMIFGGD